jgi:hypothetical protein
LFFIAFPLFKEDRAGVGAVDAHVTHGASLALGVLRVRRVIEVLVALEAQSVHPRARQQPRIRGTVRRVTCRTTLGPDRFMLENKRSTLFGVTLVADCILRGIRAKLLRQYRSVHVMAVLALNVAFHHAVAEWLQEVGFRFVVAGEAKVGILLDQELLSDCRNVSRVAGGTGDSVLVVYRTIEILVLEIVLVARHAALGDLFWFLVAEAEDLRLVAAAIDVCGSRSVARFAPMPFLSATLRRESLVMRRALYVLELILVTRLAIVSTNVLRGITSFLRSRRFRLLILRRGTRRRAEPKDQRRDQHGGDLSR